MFDDITLGFKEGSHTFLTVEVEDPAPWLEEKRGQTEPIEDYLLEVESRPDAADCLPRYEEIIDAAIDEIPVILGKKYTKHEYARPEDQDTSTLENAINIRKGFWRERIDSDDFYGLFSNDAEVVYGFVPPNDHPIDGYDIDNRTDAPV